VDRYRRLNTLIDLLTERGRLDIEEVAAELNVSDATIRRDLDHLAEQQLLSRTRGGAVSNAVFYDLPLRYKVSRHASEKQRIGTAVAALVAQGSVVSLTGGTTTTEVARAIAARATALSTGPSPWITIVTNAVNIANELAVRPQVRILMTGGVAMPQSYCLVGQLAEHTVSEVSIDFAVLGVNGIDPDFGATTQDEGEAGINALMAEHAKTVIVATDSSKLGRRAFVRICKPSDVDILVTDDQAPDDLVAKFERAGMEVRRV
jgi:DeoR family transcriptional regulator of aga operon